MTAVRTALYGCLITVWTASAAFSGEVWEAMLYEGRPGGLGCGLARAYVVYEGALGVVWENETLSISTKALGDILSEIREKRNELVILDIERVPRTHVRQVTDLVRNFKAQLPDANIGVYDLVPQLTYWEVNGKKHEGVREGREQKTELEEAALAREVDIVFPSLYRHYADDEGWRKYAVAKLRRAHDFGKKVLPFMWPQYHDSNEHLGGQFIEPKKWRKMLELAWSEADGFVLWGGWRDREGRRLRWDDEAPWWLETKRFLEEVGFPCVGSGPLGGATGR